MLPPISVSLSLIATDPSQICVACADTRLFFFFSLLLRATYSFQEKGNRPHRLASWSMLISCFKFYKYCKLESNRDETKKFYNVCIFLYCLIFQIVLNYFGKWWLEFERHWCWSFVSLEVAIAILKVNIISDIFWDWIVLDFLRLK